MSRTKKGHKAPGYDYSAARPGNRCWSLSPSGPHAGSKWQKRLTHKAERRAGKIKPGDADA
jgi:hypothetical protein